MPADDRTPFNDTDPFSRAEARSAGISDKELRSGRYQRLFYELYLSAEVVVTQALRAKAVLKVCPRGSQVSHLHRGRAVGRHRGEPATTSAAATRIANPAAGDGLSSVEQPRRVVRFRGIRVSSPEQTFIDPA